MSELCSVPRVSERFAQSNALDEDIARLKYVSGKREGPFAVWEFGRWGTSFSISLIDILTLRAFGPSRWHPSVPCAR